MNIVMLAARWRNAETDLNMIIGCQYDTQTKKCTDFTVALLSSGLGRLTGSKTGFVAHVDLQDVFSHLVPPDRVVMLCPKDLEDFLDPYFIMCRSFKESPILLSVDVNDPSVRRALVHDTNDGLQIDKDTEEYPEARLALRYHLGINKSEAHMS